MFTTLKHDYGYGYIFSFFLLTSFLVPAYTTRLTVTSRFHTQAESTAQISSFNLKRNLNHGVMLRSVVLLRNAMVRNSEHVPLEKYSRWNFHIARKQTTLSPLATSERKIKASSVSLTYLMEDGKKKKVYCCDILIPLR
ncbi:hypothetical protein CEXT_246061 [Caerostris extrusa]|uniref:Uncharacterized protein n=1 Tax=Caerostris extrusa TaxID=172846 RepID=A0AAV4WNZ1_CAEEX|nr:hypothetical protein CEXT_246061 [Caerostris extrusa]